MAKKLWSRVKRMVWTLQEGCLRRDMKTFVSCINSATGVLARGRPLVKVKQYMKKQTRKKV